MTNSRPPENHPFKEFFREESPFGEADPLRSDGFATEPETRRSRRSPSKPRKSRKGLLALVLVLVLLGTLGGVATAIYFSYQTQINKILGLTEPNDFVGTGTGEKVLFVIDSGDVGEVIGDKLAAAGVVKTSEAFYTLLLKHSSVIFQPGTYSLSKEMSAQAALDALQDPANRVENTLTVPEGTVSANVLADLSAVTDVPLADLQSAATDLAALGIPASAPNIEGYLFPATYTFEPNMSAHDLLKIMVDRTFEALDAAGVAPADRERVLTLASIIQKEARLKDDFYKASRVFTNRIAEEMLLESDATVAYGTGQRRVDTTSAERADASNLYNTYQHEGLPVGPISNPGDLAIDAALHPAEGTWLFFVTWNLDTGETIFSTTQSEHEAGVKKYREWSAENPDFE